MWCNLSAETLNTVLAISCSIYNLVRYTADIGHLNYKVILWEHIRKTILAKISQTLLWVWSVFCISKWPMQRPEYSLLPDQRSNLFVLFLWSGNRLFSGLWADVKFTEEHTKKDHWRNKAKYIGPRFDPGPQMLSIHAQVHVLLARPFNPVSCPCFTHSITPKDFDIWNYVLPDRQENTSLVRGCGS